MLKSVNQWCFPEGTPLGEIFATCQRAGIEALELNVYEPGGVGLTMNTTASEAEAIGAMARDHGIRLRSVSTGLMGKYPLSSTDPAVREKGRTVILKQLELAGVLGCDTVLVVPGFVTPDTAYNECYRLSQEELARVLPEAESLGIHVAIENVWNKFLLSPLEMARYIDELNSPYAGAYYDVGNTLLTGFPDQWIRILNKRIRKVHVKDFKTGVGNHYGFVPLLAGDVDWRRVVAALRGIGYTDTVTAEVMPYPHLGAESVYDIARQLDVIIRL